MARARRLGCGLKHFMVRSVAQGWFVCQGCGLVAGCVGCVTVPYGSLVHLCAEHEQLAALNGVAARIVEAREESIR